MPLQLTSGTDDAASFNSFRNELLILRSRLSGVTWGGLGSTDAVQPWWSDLSIGLQHRQWWGGCYV